MSFNRLFRLFAKYDSLAFIVLLVGLGMILAPMPALAANCVSTSSGNWNDPAIWTGCSIGIPSPGDSVVINAGHTVTLDTDANILGLTISAGGVLRPDAAGTRNLTVSENLINNGTLMTINGSGRLDITMNGIGTPLLTPGSSTVFNNLKVNTKDYGLAGYWKLDEGSGTSAADASGTVSPNHGTLTGSTLPAWASTAAPTVFADAYSLSFNGSNGQYVHVPDASTLNFNTSRNFTLAAWIRSNSSSPQPEGTGIIVKGNGGAEQYALDFDSSGCLRFSVRDGSGILSFVSAPTICPITSANGWIHVGATMDGGTNLLTLYVNSYDGTPVPPTSAAPPSLLSNTHEVSIGSRQSGSTNYDRTFNGLMDDVRIYNRPLGGDEILRLYRGWWPNSVELGSVLNVNGNLTIESTALDVTETTVPNYAVNLAGNLINNCCFQPRYGTFTFDGVGIHTITGSTKTIRFYNLTIPDGVIVEAGSTLSTIVGTLSLGANGLGQLRRTPSGNAIGDCSTGSVSEKDATNNTTITLSSCSGTEFTSATIRTAQGGNFPSIDLAGSPKYDTCPASSNLVRRYWQITPNGSGTRTATVTFHYLPSELNGNNQNNLHVYKCTNGNWVDQGLATSGTSGAYYTATKTGVSIGSGYALAENRPTSVKLTSLQARADSVMGIAWIIPGVVLAMVLSVWMFRRTDRRKESE